MTARLPYLGFPVSFVHCQSIKARFPPVTSDLDLQSWQDEPSYPTSGSEVISSESCWLYIQTHSNSISTTKITCIYFRQIPGEKAALQDMNLLTNGRPKISHPVYQVNVTIIRYIHSYHHHLPNNWTGANFFITGCSFLSFYQLKISRRTNEIPDISSISRISRKLQTIWNSRCSYYSPT